MKRLKFLRRVSLLLDLTLLLPVIIGGIFLKLYRKIGSKYLVFCTNVLRRLGVFPIIDHYYEPWFNGYTEFSGNRAEEKFNIKQQTNLLEKFCFADEFRLLVEGHLAQVPFHFELNNGSFGSGDAELLYNFVRLKKPKRIIEIGCGSSTKLMVAASVQNELEGCKCEHICIEPFEQPWLEELDGVQVVRECVEKLDFDWNEKLNAGDLLFIDSSHMLRPGGDVHYEYSEILPSLKRGVYIHIHDIFTPKNYLRDWLDKEVKFWNEQYIFECILVNSNRYEVILGANYLKHNAFKDLEKICIYLTRKREPGSIYLQVK